jgi:DNA-binding NtrC family response regulator
MPPLREHPEDIPLLVRHFVVHFTDLYQRRVQGFDAASMERLCAYHWPGNVRELKHLVERHVALADGPVLHVEELSGPGPAGTLDDDLPTLAELEQRYILKVLQRFGGNRELTARTLGINKSTLWRRLQQYAPDEQS